MRHLSLAEHIDGFTVVPESIGQQLPTGVAVVSIEDPPTIELRLVWSPARATASVRRLVDLGRQTLSGRRINPTVDDRSPAACDDPPREDIGVA